MSKWIGRWVCEKCGIDEHKEFLSKDAAEAWATQSERAHVLTANIHVTASKVKL